MHKTVFTLLLFLLIVASDVLAEDNVELGTTYLYLPDEAMASRVVEREKFVKYIVDAAEMVAPALSKFKSEKPVSGGVIVTVRPEKDVKVWFDIRTGVLSDIQKKAIEDSILSLPAESVQNGIVPFAVAFKAFGAENFIDSLPIAPEWKRSSEKHGNMEMSKLIALAWTDLDLTKR
jgi:hypothetical protein